MTERLNVGGEPGDFERLMAEVIKSPTDPAELDKLYAGERVDVSASGESEFDALWDLVMDSKPSDLVGNQSPTEIVRELRERLGYDGLLHICDALDPPSDDLGQ